MNKDSRRSSMSFIWPKSSTWNNRSPGRASFSRRCSMQGLASSRVVREVRVFGLLIAIELEIEGWPRRWLRKRLASFYLLGMLRHDDFPVFAGLCQYEPSVIKITPPLSASPEEIRQACATIVDVLSRPLYKVARAGARRPHQVTLYSYWKKNP